MALSAPTVESGRLLTVGESRELGLCCHESVPERASPALLGGGVGLTGSAIGVLSLFRGANSTESRSMLPVLGENLAGESVI